MSRSPLPGVDVRGNREGVRRRVYLVVTLSAMLSQFSILGLNLLQRASGADAALRTDALYGALLCAVILLLLLTRLTSLRRIEYGVIVGATLGVGVQFAQAFGKPGPPAQPVYFMALFLFLAAFSILPTRLALAYSAALYLVVGALVLSRDVPGDLTLLLNLGMAAVLIVQLSVFGQQVSSERGEAQLYQALAYSDSLTGLENRRAMYPRLDEAHAGVTATRVQARPATMLLLDIDHFKTINDQHGHLLGDQVLRAVASVLQGAAVGAGEGQVNVARWGGEEFLILFTGDAALRAPVLADQLLYQVRRAPMPAGVSVTFSGGLAHSHEAASVPAWLHLADQRQYQAKAQGRNQVQQAV
jgi:diguanylate cyclase